MMIYITCALSDSCHEVTSCIGLLESLSFSIAFCQSCRPPTTESCCFAKWPRLWQSWRTISAIATFFIYDLMVSARGRRPVQLTKLYPTWAFGSMQLILILFPVSCCFDSVRWFIGQMWAFTDRISRTIEVSYRMAVWFFSIKYFGKDKWLVLYFSIRSFFKSESIFHYELLKS